MGLVAFLELHSFKFFWVYHFLPWEFSIVIWEKGAFCYEKFMVFRAVGVPLFGEVVYQMVIFSG